MPRKQSMRASYPEAARNRILVSGGIITVAALGFAIGRLTAPASGRSNSDAAEIGTTQSTSTLPEHRAVQAITEGLAQVRVDRLSHVPLSELHGFMLDRDPKELLELARKFDSYPPDPQTYANLRPFFKTWAQIDADAAFAGAKAIKDLLCREIATMESLKRRVQKAQAGSRTSSSNSRTKHIGTSCATNSWTRRLKTGANQIQLAPWSFWRLIRVY